MNAIAQIQTYRCRYCGEEIKRDADGDWIDRETLTFCQGKGSGRQGSKRKHDAHKALARTPTCCAGSFRSSACGNCDKPGQFTDGSLVVRCSKCHGQLIYKWLRSTEIEIYHSCNTEAPNEDKT